MLDTSVPDLENVDDRQAALRRYHVLDTPPEKDFDRITSLVAKVCEVPTALITLIDKERQCFKSCFGLGADIRETDADEDSDILGTARNMFEDLDDLGASRNGPQ